MATEGKAARSAAAKRGWALSTFQWWRARAKQANARPAQAVSFLPLATLAENGVWAAELSLWLEGVDLVRTRRFARVEASRVL